MKQQTQHTTSLPDGWRWEKLGIACHVQSGGTPSSGIAKYYGGDIPWAITEDLTAAGQTISQTKQTITEAGLEDSGAKIFPPNTVLFAIYGASIGRSSINTVPLATNQAILGIVPKNPKELDYLFLYFILSASVKELLKESRTGAQPNLNAQIVKNLLIPLPPTLEEQRSIAERISTRLAEAERIRHAAERQYEAAKALAGAIVREALPEELPDGWRWEKLGDHITSTQSGVASGDKSRTKGVIHLRMNNISRRGLMDTEQLWRIPASEKILKDYSLTDGDILFNNTNSPELVGKTCLFTPNTKEPYLFSNHLTRIRTKESLEPRYLAYFINDLWEQRYFEKTCESWVNQAAIRFEASVFPILIPLPPTLEEQRSIAERISTRLAEAERVRHAAERQYEAAKALAGAIVREAFPFHHDISEQR